MCCVCILRTDQCSSLAAAALTLHSPPPTRILTTAYTSATHTDSACVAGSTKRTQSVCLSQRGPTAANPAGECEQCHVVSVHTELVSLTYLASPPPRQRCEALLSAYQSVSPHARVHISETTCPNFIKISVHICHQAVQIGTGQAATMSSAGKVAVSLASHWPCIAD